MHISLINLRKISANLRKILAQSNKISRDWEHEKKVHSGNYGYLNLAVNYPEIMEEIALIKQLVKSFNESRYNMWKHRILILNHRKDKIEYIDLKPDSSKKLQFLFHYCEKNSE